jgi:hypothetical protein
VAFSLLCLAFRTLLGALVRCRRGLDVKDVELLVLRHELLRHELEVPRRQVARSKLHAADRALRAAAASRLPRPSLRALGDPRTLLRGIGALVRRKWRQSPGKRGRPPVRAEVRAVALRLARENPRCGGIGGSAASWPSSAYGSRQRLSAGCSPAQDCGRLRRGSGPGWREFLRAQAATIVACDFFTGRERVVAPLLGVVLHRTRKPAGLADRRLA